MNLFDLSLEELRGYRPDMTKKRDFDTFWDEKINESNSQPLHCEVKGVEGIDPTILHEELYFDGFRNSRIRVRVLSLKQNRSSKLLVHYHGYAWNFNSVSDYYKYVYLGFTVALVDVRGQNLATPDHAHYENGGPMGWMTLGIVNPNNYYYLHVYMDCYRAVEALKNIFEVSSISVMGASQGGALSIAVGALHKGVTKIISEITFLSHFQRSVKISTDGPYPEIYKFFKYHDQHHELEERVYDTLSYFDCMNLADKITAEVMMTVGLEDTVCPPSTVFAVYNAISSKKEIRVYPEHAHGGFTQHEEFKMKFLMKE